MNEVPDRTRRAHPPGAGGTDEPLLFVYGSLQRGLTGSSLLRGCRWLAPARLRGTLFDLGEYPALVLVGRGAVQGELWECAPETLPVLDSYEGVAEGLFQRVRVEVGDRAAWTYIAGPALQRRLATAAEIPSGVWGRGRG